MAVMQDHPIDLVREQLAQVGQGVGQGLIGLMTGLALVGGLWLGSLKPADAAGPGLAPDFAARAEAEGHLGAAALSLGGRALAGAGVQDAAFPVCRLALDPEAEAQPATCAPVEAEVVTQ